MPKKSSDTGLFITLEGTEGSGKSTLAQSLLKDLRPLGREIVLTREPGGTPVTEKIRGIILNETMDPWTELFLYEAARAQHFKDVIEPALSRGAIVICDRFTDSSLAYQAHARKLPWKDVHYLNRLASYGRKPNLTILLDIDPKVGLERAKDHNRFEAEGLKFHEKVRKGFLKARKIYPKRWLVIKPKDLTPDQLSQRVLKELKKRRWIGEKKSG